MKAHGINAASITYDSREILEAFGAAYNIEYPLLSDAGSKVIRAFGILNTNVPQDHQMMYGMPFPGDYLVAPDHTVRDKLFLPSYEHRASVSQVVLKHFSDDTGANSVDITTGPLTATVSLATDRCFPGQELAVSLHIRLKPGWHIYGRPLTGNYEPTELHLDSPIVGNQSLQLPPPSPILLKALGETLPAYTGEIRAVGKPGIKWSPPAETKFLESSGDRIEPGRYKIKGTLRFQTCSDEVCEMPEAIPFELPLTMEPGIPPAPKKAT